MEQEVIVYDRKCYGHGKIPKPFKTTICWEHFCPDCRKALDELVETINRCQINLEKHSKDTP